MAKSKKQEQEELVEGVDNGNDEPVIEIADVPAGVTMNKTVKLRRTRDGAEAIVREEDVEEWRQRHGYDEIIG